MRGKGSYRKNIKILEAMQNIIINKIIFNKNRLYSTQKLFDKTDFLQINQKYL